MGLVFLVVCVIVCELVRIFGFKSCYLHMHAWMHAHKRKHINDKAGCSVIFDTYLLNVKVELLIQVVYFETFDDQIICWFGRFFGEPKP